MSTSTAEPIRHLRVELSPEQHRAIRLAAAIEEESMTAFAKRAIILRAKQALGEAERQDDKEASESPK